MVLKRSCSGRVVCSDALHGMGATAMHSLPGLHHTILDVAHVHSHDIEQGHNVFYSDFGPILWLDST
jgi:hypothetical protein